MNYCLMVSKRTSNGFDIKYLTVHGDWKRKVEVDNNRILQFTSHVKVINYIKTNRLDSKRPYGYNPILIDIFLDK